VLLAVQETKGEWAEEISMKHEQMEKTHGKWKRVLWETAFICMLILKHGAMNLTNESRYTGTLAAIPLQTVRMIC
jgi:hypothetical protein